MIRIAPALLPFLACVVPLSGQNPNLVTLEIDVTNGIGYETDTFEYEKFASSATPVARKTPRAFAKFNILYDVVAVNGQPVKGNMVFRSHRIAMGPNPIPGQSIGDITRGTIGSWVIEILNPDGTQIGSLMMTGFPNGDPPPGSPASSFTHNMAITGGTGIFLGARGYFGGAQQPFSIPNAGTFQNLSVTTDPSQRRTLNGGTFGQVAQFVTLFQPVVREVLHADFTPVTAASPARRGEVLILRASGLGPVKGLALGRPLPDVPCCSSDFAG